MVLGRGPRPAAAPATQQQASGAPGAVAPSETPAGGGATTPPATSAPPLAIKGLHARPGVDPGVAPASLGSLDPFAAKLFLEFAGGPGFTDSGGGLARITFSEFWRDAAAKRQAAAHSLAVASGVPSPPPLPPEPERYVLGSALPYGGVNVPILAASSIELNGQQVRLLWQETAPGHFRCEILDEDEDPVLEIIRWYELGDGYDFALRQRVRNRSGGAIEVRWLQYGPSDLEPDRSPYIDPRRLRLGERRDPVGLPHRVSSGNDELIARSTATGNVFSADRAARAGDLSRAEALTTIWPPGNQPPDHGEDLAWFATTDRYFTLALHPIGAALGMPASPPITGVIEKVSIGGYPPNNKDTMVLLTGLKSPLRRLEAGEEAAFDMGVYAGPLDPAVLKRQEPMASLEMDQLVLYQMSTWWCFALCTFQWLAHLLLWFLGAVHFVLRDWGVSIIILVMVVRTLLHPLTRKAQISMTRLGKAMVELKPEMEKLQQKYAGEPKKLQVETLKLYRERGVNPFQMLGCLPLFLQSPIWIALYAMLYFAFELWQQPAFWGVFQLFGGWQFLADLSAPDHCFWEFKQPIHFLLWELTGVNLLPPLMGLVFFFQQKYMTPPPSPSMTKEQIQQQNIMKIMMVVMFPLMLYSAPSGLTLYIFTSSLFGIIESRYIRAHIKELELKPPAKRATSKPRGALGRAFASAMDRARKRHQEKRDPPKKFKRRKE